MVFVVRGMGTSCYRVLLECCDIDEFLSMRSHLDQWIGAKWLAP